LPPQISFKLSITVAGWNDFRIAYLSFVRSRMIVGKNSGSEKLLTWPLSLQQGTLTNLGHGVKIKTGFDP
jgi:hypothetical protein